jgi:tRNA (guanine-N7-)-methyltransferase
VTPRVAIVEPPGLPKTAPASLQKTDGYAHFQVMDLEIGMGRPYFLLDRARAFKNRPITGIEYKKAFVETALKTKEREGLSHVTALYADAKQVVPALFEEGSLSAIFINFPDPWWKKRHAKRKILNTPFVDILVSKLKIGGEIFVQSDVYDLFNDYASCLENHPQLRNCNGKGALCDDNPTSARSHRERKCLEQGIPVYRALFVKET